MTLKVRKPRRLFGLAGGGVFAACLALGLAAPAGADAAEMKVLRGTVQTGSTEAEPLKGYSVALYAAYPHNKTPKWVLLGNGKSRAEGKFRIRYAAPKGDGYDGKPVLFVLASKGKSMLAVVQPAGSPSKRVTVNELTTVAAGTANAQFIIGSPAFGEKYPAVLGNKYGVINAAMMAENLANPKTGLAGDMIARIPNGPKRDTFKTFHSIANAVAACVASQRRCDQLFSATTPPGGTKPASVLEAVANIAKYPSYPGYDGNSPKDPLFRLTKKGSVYADVLKSRPTNWLLYLKITGGEYQVQNADNAMNGPGNFAIGRKGTVWVNNNYVPENRRTPACTGKRLLKFSPAGHLQDIFFGGGLNGSGYGITMDRNGKIWASNFGFESQACSEDPETAANHKSFSVFRKTGKPVSPDRGYRNGFVYWPQGIMSDANGNVWMGNCRNDSATLVPGGDHTAAINTRLKGGVAEFPYPGDTVPPSTDDPARIKPFGLAVDGYNRAWVVGNLGETLSVIDTDGTLIKTIKNPKDGAKILKRPMGNAADSMGNIWVANSDKIDVPCPPPIGNFADGEDPSVTLFDPDTFEGEVYRGGGLTVPWGIIVDGSDTVWVFNFGAEFNPPYSGDEVIPDTPISRFCGASADRCPQSRTDGILSTGDPISPDTGYTSDVFERITAGKIDRSGNIFITTNWKKIVDPAVNPGGNSIIVVVGAATPVKTPLIGTPRPFD